MTIFTTKKKENVLFYWIYTECFIGYSCLGRGIIHVRGGGWKIVIPREILYCCQGCNFRSM